MATKWDYYALQVSAHAPEIDTIDRLGRDGWEMCASYVRPDNEVQLWFKRPSSAQ